MEGPQKLKADNGQGGGHEKVNILFNQGRRGKDHDYMHVGLAQKKMIFFMTVPFSTLFTDWGESYVLYKMFLLQVKVTNSFG